MLRDRVLRRAGLPIDTRFQISTEYSDDQFMALLRASQQETGLARSQLMELYAQHFLAYAEHLFPRFFSMSSGARDFLIRQPVIHASFAAGLRGVESRQAVVDKFILTSGEDGSLEVRYRSANRLCDLYQALARALGLRYSESVEVEVLQCANRCGSSDCSLRVFWPGHQHAVGGQPGCPAIGVGSD